MVSENYITMVYYMCALSTDAIPIITIHSIYLALDIDGTLVVNIYVVLANNIKLLI